MSASAALPPVSRSALISPCGRYRYELWRRWDADRPTLYVGMLNPSKADAERDDPTVRKVIGFGRRLGAGAIAIWNLYAYRATNPRELTQVFDPIGPYNDAFLERLFVRARLEGAICVAAWGAHAQAKRADAVRDLMRDCGIGPMHWGLTQSEQPRHPLMLPYSTPLSPLFNAF